MLRCCSHRHQTFSSITTAAKPALRSPASSSSFPHRFHLSFHTSTSIAMGNSSGHNPDNDIYRSRLSREAYHVTREGGTERPFSGEYHNHQGDGEYRCVCCDDALFDSEHKYDSGTGWPSFYRVAADSQVKERQDFSLLMPRTEVLCKSCDAHLGHVFSDGPPPTGLRYCINSAALRFVSRQKST